MYKVLEYNRAKIANSENSTKLELIYDFYHTRGGPWKPNIYLFPKNFA